MAEGIGTFALAFAVLLSASLETPMIATPIIAGLVLGLFVYSIGHVSGCHINPAVTVGVWSLGKMKLNDAIYYIIAQAAGAVVALVVASLLLGGPIAIGLVPESWLTFIAELIGTALFAFGIASVLYGKAAAGTSGLVIGGSLLLGTLVAVYLGSAGMLNPAVALALGSLSISYVGGAVIGSALGMWLYRKVGM